METTTAPVLTVSAAQLIACGADKRFAGRYVDALNARLANAQINTPLRLCHLLAQLLHESDRMRTAEEYASGKAYEGRADLGNVHPGDGVRFKGRGLIQNTGRKNYEAFSKYTDIDYVAHPELLERPDDAVAVSLWYWTTRKLNHYADLDDVLSISQIINMGSVPKANPGKKLPNGYSDRVALLRKCKAVFLINLQ